MNDDARIVVFIGTKAQFIKTAPILRELDFRKISYRLVYTGQHSETFDVLETAFGTRPADDFFVPNFEASTHTSFIRWSWAFWRSVVVRLRKREWASARVGLVHGDTASTLFCAFALKLARVPVAHVESGLRSTKLFEPFPEEIVRRLVSQISSLHFAPDAKACANLESVKGQIVDTGGNTLRDALVMAISSFRDFPSLGGWGNYIVVSTHRSENLGNRATFDMLMNEIILAADIVHIKFVLHPATRERIRRTGWLVKLQRHPSVELMERMSYPDFVNLLTGANCLLTDGGSNQEEAAMLGLPTLLLRRATERLDGLNDNVVLSNLKVDSIREFVIQHAKTSWEVRLISQSSPSKMIVDTLTQYINS